MASTSHATGIALVPPAFASFSLRCSFLSLLYLLSLALPGAGRLLWDSRALGHSLHFPVQQTFPCLCVTTQKAHTSHSHVLIIQRSWDLHSELGSTRHLNSKMAACDLEEFEHRLPLGPSKTLDCCLSDNQYLTVLQFHHLYVLLLVYHVMINLLQVTRPWVLWLLPCSCRSV